MITITNDVQYCNEEIDLSVIADIFHKLFPSYNLTNKLSLTHYKDKDYFSLTGWCGDLKPSIRKIIEQTPLIEDWENAECLRFRFGYEPNNNKWIVDGWNTICKYFIFNIDGKYNLVQQNDYQRMIPVYENHCSGFHTTRKFLTDSEEKMKKGFNCVKHLCKMLKDGGIMGNLEKLTEMRDSIKELEEKTLQMIDNYDKINSDFN